jgi:magnesium-transporting ATPase (P-type)
VASKVDLKALYARLDCSTEGLTTAVASARLTQYGRNALERKKKSQLRVLLSYFWTPMAWMIEGVDDRSGGAHGAARPGRRRLRRHPGPAPLQRGARHERRGALILVSVEIARGARLLKLAEFVLILLVASVPVAMPAVLSVTMALGAKALAKKRAIVSRLESIEEMAGMDILASDKTGTLTQNRLTLGEVVTWGGADARDVLLAGALALRAEDRDPIDLAVLEGTKDPEVLKSYEQVKFVPFDPVRSAPRRR